MSKRLERDLVGHVLMDADLDLGASYCLISGQNSAVQRGTFVRIQGDDKDFYVCQIVDGPFYVKNSDGINETIYKVRLSGVISNGTQRAVFDRPKPKAPVYLLDKELVQEFLGVVGDLAIGRLSTQEMVNIGLDSATLSRHVGIFGTTGAGKSNTLQVMMEEASRVGMAVLVFDIEGEYVMMDQPTDRLLVLVNKFGLKPAGVSDLSVYVPHGSDSLRGDAKRFGIRFVDADRQVFSEVAELTGNEQIYFYDLIQKVEAVAPAFRKVTLEKVLERLRGRLSAQADNPTLPGYIAEAHAGLYSKLVAIENLKIVDAPSPSIDPMDILVPGRITVMDVSDASDPVKNLAIANLLDNLFKHKILHADTSGLFVAIEEAHTFISREKRGRMMATLTLVLELARRGRKRGICLNIVTQQPAHLPPELLELCNTRIIHRMSSSTNIDALRESTGNISAATWDSLPSLGKGEAIISSPKYVSGIVTQVRPVVSKRLATE
jgi:DNA helicase HerA-like ATPase